MLRQPLRSALLVFLVALAAFGFVMRTAEFMIVRNQIMGAAEFYRASGFISHPDLFGDVTDGIEIIAGHPYFSHEDTRRAAEGLLTDMLNADVTGFHPQALFFRSAARRTPTRTETYFYAYLEDISQLVGRNIALTLRVDDVLAGHEEYILAGQLMRMYFRAEPGIDRFALDNMQIGERYLLRGAYIERSAPPPWNMFGPIIPRPGVINDYLTMWPLNDSFESRFDHIWYAHVPTGHEAPFDFPDLAHIPSEIEAINISQRSILLQATKDMSTIPQLDGVFRLAQGRLINHSDYVNARQVAVVDSGFASMRGLYVGSTITVDIPKEQGYFGNISIPGPGFALPHIRVDRNHPERFDDVYRVELEIVGITQFVAAHRSSIQSLFIFVPDSILPGDFSIEWTPRIVVDRQWVYLPAVDFGVDYIPDIWYSFILSDSRYLHDFYGDYSETFAELGLDLIMVYTDSTNFWRSAGPILLITTFNAALFWIVLLLVLGLVAFLYIRQRQRDFAIMRALGMPIKKIYIRLMVSALLFSLPAAIIGGGSAWFFAVSESENTLAAFEEAYEEVTPPNAFELQWQQFFGDRPVPAAFASRTIKTTAELDFNWIIVFIAIVAAAMLIMVMFGGFRVLNLPVLELLQGKASQAKPARIRRSEIVSQAPNINNLKFSVSPSNLNGSRYGALRSALLFIRRHIMRSPIKSTLGLAVALFFVFALGWLQGSIITTENEIDRIYDTTIVRAQAVHNPIFVDTGRYIDDVIQWFVLDGIMETGYVSNIYKEMGYTRSFIIANDNGTLPRIWRSLLRVYSPLIPLNSISTMANLDFVIGLNSLDMFMQRHTAPPAARGFQEISELSYINEESAYNNLGDFEVWFAEGFDTSIFESENHDPGSPIPVIVSGRTLYRRRLELGDEAIFAYFTINEVHPHYKHVIIAGVHNEQIHIKNMQYAVLMPYYALNDILNAWARYIILDFEIDPAFNRNLTQVRNDLELIISPLQPMAGHVVLEAMPPPLVLNFHDGELRSVINSLEQILLLLELLYPVAIALAVIIGAGLSMLLMLQNTKNAAIMRILGTSKQKSWIMLWTEQIVICLSGLVVGLITLIIIGWSFEVMVMLALMYLAGVVIGSSIGALVVTNKAPLDLLQVRE